MDGAQHAQGPSRIHARPAGPVSGARLRRSALLGGGTDGNEELTATTGVVLIVLFAVLGLTILRIRQLISVHLFVGLLLLGPVALKLASTGYRFARYYSRNDAYWTKGPPERGLRLIAPLLVASTLIAFASGIVLLFEGPARRAQWLMIHKVSFIVWLAVTALHVLGHLRQLPQSLRAARLDDSGARISPGGAGRWISLAGALVGGLVLVLVLTGYFVAWTAPGVFPHHHPG